VSGKLASALRLAAINLAVLGLALAATNLASWGILASYRGARDGLRGAEPPAPPLWELPNYGDVDRAYAEKIFSEFNGGIETRYEPFIGWTRLPYRGITITIDEAGDRVHPSPPPSRARGVVRFFGGSTMWGTGVDDRGTIPALFAAMNPGFEVHNHGETAYTSRQSLDRLINLIAAGEAIDLAVFFDGVNDVVQQCRRGIPVPGHSRVLQIREALEALRPEAWYEPFVPLARRLFVAHSVDLGQSVLRKLGLRQEEEPPGLYECSESPEKARAVADNLIATWRIAHTLVEAEGGELIALLQPSAHTGSPRVDHLERHLDPELGREFAAVYPVIQERIREVGEPWIHDLTRAFDREDTGDQFILIDDFHATANGNAIVARRVAALVGRETRSAGP